MRIPYNYLDRQFGAVETEEILDDLRDLVRTGEFTIGPPVLEFERRLGAMIGVKHVVGTNTGTDAHNNGAGAHNSGTRSNGTSGRAAGGDSAGCRRSGRSGRGNGCRAWSGSSGRGSDCCPRPGRRGRAAQAGDGAVHAPFVCRAWRDPQGADGSRLEPPVAAARAAGAAAGDPSRAVQRNGGDRRVGSGRHRHRLQRLPRRGSAPAGESRAAEVGLADAARAKQHLLERCDDVQVIEDLMPR